MAINVQGLQGQWNQLKGEVKKRWGQLTEDDLKWSGGNIDQLVGRIQQRTGENRDAIEKYLDQLTSQGSSVVSNAVESVGSYAQDITHRLRDHYGDISEHAQEGYVDRPRLREPQSHAVAGDRLRRRRADRRVHGRRPEQQLLAPALLLNAVQTLGPAGRCASGTVPVLSLINRAGRISERSENSAITVPERGAHAPVRPATSAFGSRGEATALVPWSTRAVPAPVASPRTRTAASVNSCR